MNNIISLFLIYGSIGGLMLFLLIYLLAYIANIFVQLP